MISQPKIFTVWNDELEGILSPLFFTSKPVNKKGFVELKEIATVNPPRKKPIFENDALVPYVGLPETEDQQIREIWMRPFKQVKGRNIIRKGDILFARIEPSVFNKKYIFVDDLRGNEFAFTSTEFYIVEPKENINPLFLFHMLFVDPVYNQVIGKTTGSTGRRRLDKGVFKKILIPFPACAIQDKIVEHLTKAYDEKRKKEEEIKKILASIDDFVLGELGIEIPEGGAEQVYEIWSDKVTERIDPYFHLPKFEKLYEQIRKCRNIKKLKDIVDELDYGLMPTQDYAESENSGIPIIRVTNIMPDGTIDMADVKYIPFNTPRLDKKRVKENDILMVQCGSTTGKVALVPKQFENYTFGSFSFVIRGKKSEVTQDYLFAVLMSPLVQNQIKRTLNIVTVRPNTSKPAVGDLLIPVPPLSVQKKIGDFIQTAYAEKRKKEEEIKKILASIDDFVLGELGIDIAGKYERVSESATEGILRGDSAQAK